MFDPRSNTVACFVWKSNFPSFCVWRRLRFLRTLAMSLVDDNPVSPFDVDLGGHQRAELRTGLRSASLELRAAREERLLIESRLSALCNRHALACAQQHERRTLQPVFSAWRRLCVVARAQMDHARTISSLEQEVHAKATVAAEKAEQVVARGERVVRVKTNAQSKLSELSEANKKLAAALEQRDACLLYTSPSPRDS